MKRSQFVVLDPPRKPPLATKRSRAKLPSFAVEHKVFGSGKLVGLRLGDSGVFIADIIFGDGIKRSLRVEASFFNTPIESIVALAARFPEAKAKPGVEEKDEPDDDDGLDDSERSEDAELEMVAGVRSSRSREAPWAEDYPHSSKTS